MNQIATDQEQSARLLACGVDKQTSDFYWCKFFFEEPFLTMGEIPRNNETAEVMSDDDVPAWGLSALIALLPATIKRKGIPFRLVMGPNGSRWEIEYNDTSITHNVARTSAENPIEACVLMIEWLTKNGYKLNDIK